ncbi:MAG: hypothetical protein QGH70_03055 [Nitrospinota bacterium]|jgi:hypothetical protein|nr:hypothetical protein [Nitrospinota bacterium]MDP6482812.1 hypothetical protein [Nitrospinota bacterium]MDP6617821.1 hypothetical protein [Nitrospinota bacterium]
MIKPRGEFTRSPSPWWYSFLFLNWWKLVKIKFDKTKGAFYANFPDTAPLGSKVPTLDLETTDGRRVNTADLIGKKLQLFEFGAIT